ncbi:hypothetical protein DRO60_01445 [Candidatus Bathyarchaeota archaeon]|nr:MAG: hypothetical protein DRO60_01445 [Candidatus Bathyarchaeota archaeon]
MCSTGLRHEVLFCLRGYTPHFVEHVIDPRDGRAKLVMADPHTRRSAMIYDLASGRVEWEAEVPGSSVPNPHTARMLLSDVENFGSAGDIYCCDRDNCIIVIDRETKGIKFKGKVPWRPGLIHEACLTPDGSALIVTDYLENRLAKLAIPSLEPEWIRRDLERPSKVSVIEGMVDPWHNPSFGGHYIVCSNAIPGSVNEVRDEDGTIAWSCPRADRTGFWPLAPHSAFRLGRLECRGNLTVVGSEAGGGIYALDYFGRPVWAVSGSSVLRAEEGLYYSASPHGIGEVTHVFPTLDGRVGFCSWLGFNCAFVMAIEQLPSEQEARFVLAYEKRIENSWTYLDPPVRGEGWDEVLIVLENLGPEEVAWRVEGMAMGLLDIRGVPRGAVKLGEGRLRAGEADAFYSRRPYAWYRVAVRTLRQKAEAMLSAFVSLRKG